MKADLPQAVRQIFARVRAAAVRAPARAGAVVLAAAALAISLTLASRPVAPEAPAAIGAALYRSGDYARAANTLRAAFRADPTPALRYELAQALYGAGDFEGVLEVLAEDAAAERAPADAALRAEALMKLQRFEEARALASEAGGPYAGRLALVAARALYAQGNHAAAEASLSAALRAGGDARAEAWLFRTRIELERGALDQARAALARAKEAGAGRRAVFALETEMLVRDGRVAEARAAIAGAAAPARRGWFGARPKVRPDIDSDFLLGYADAADGDFQNAARRLRRVEATLAHELRGRLILAYVKAGAGDIAQGERLFLDAARAAPTDPVTLDAIAAFYADAERPEERGAWLARLEAVSPGLGARRRLAVADPRGDLDAALADLARGTGTSAPPFSATALFGAHAAPARRDEAMRPLLDALVAAAAAIGVADETEIKRAAAALAPYPDDPRAQALRGALLMLAGDDDGAGRAFDAANAAAPAATAPVAGLARLAVRAGDTMRAERLLDERLDARLGDPAAGDDALRLMLARIRAADGRAGNAAAALAPIADRFYQSPGAAFLYASLLAKSGASAALERFAGAAARAAPADPETVDVLTLAGMADAAAVSARRALIAAPTDPARRAAYRGALARLGRSEEAALVLAALPAAPGAEHAPPDDQFLSLADARRAYALAPGEGGAASRYGAALLREGRAAEAKRVFREACVAGAPAACAAASAEDS